MTEELLTPGQVAKNEAAKQAVMLVFGLVTAVVIMKLQSRMMQQMVQSQRAGSDPDAARTQRMKDAKRLEGWWQRAAGQVGRVYLWTCKQADKARAEYDKDRA